jgi:hypothetical protein
MLRSAPPGLNLSYRRVGGLRFLKIGRLTLSWSIATAYKPLKGAMVPVNLAAVG